MQDFYNTYYIIFFDIFSNLYYIFKNYFKYRIINFLYNLQNFVLTCCIIVLMNAELTNNILPPVPNISLKIQRQTVKSAPEFLNFPQTKIFKAVNFNFEEIFNTGFKSEETDVLIILFHLYLAGKEKDGLLYINTDDILFFRSIKKNRAGYKRNTRQRIDKIIKKLETTGLFALCDYKEFNYILDFNQNYFEDIEKIVPVNQKLLRLNPGTKSWHKSIGLYLTFIKNNITSPSCTIQIKKLLKIISASSSTKTLFPFQIRQRFEDMMDELNFEGFFKGWHYKNIDEEIFNCKNWLYFWKLLSVKIIF